ncbi:LysR family transcriptional regulator [Streptosporangium lutulentum]|uniref:DNA-binding transcriptional LysR family regulator n=1 Tax=Streptosporangium lutulentum TaxID=1461250 RepID=A0ABT9Q7T7_9ACTN|nr:LysR family transcriptional regulator [Streptosporangium lutulentum]MDP9842804.1 DNA-binding transcriptional LysR family regulator [Streptosporangium lutulentum]
MATLRALECLVALADIGSVTGAAAALHMSQPALSHQIAALERELGTPVVERLPRGVRVTVAGRAAAAEARIALQAAARAVHMGREAGAGRAGRLRIACAETMTVWLLVPVLRRWRSHHPEVHLDLMEFTSTDRMVDHLVAGGTDLVVGPRPTGAPAHIEVLGQEEMVVVTSDDHPFSGRPSVTVAELAAEPFVHYDPDNGLAVWVDRFVAGHEVALTPVVRTRSPRTAAQLAGAGMGVSIVPASALIACPAGVVRRLNPRVHRDIVAIMAAPSDGLARRFVADLRRQGLPVPDTEARPPLGGRGPGSPAPDRSTGG